MPTRKTKMPAKPTAAAAGSRNWLLRLLQWAWWPGALLALLVFVVDFVSLFTQGEAADSIRALMTSDYSAVRLDLALQAAGLAPQTFLVLRLVPDILVAISFVTVGLLIRFRRPDDWFSLSVSLWMMVFGFVSTSIFFEPVQGGLLLASYFVLVLFAYLGILVFLLTYPNGEYHPGWMRWVTVAWSLFVISTVLFEWFLWNSIQPAFVIPPLLIAVLYSQIYRYRHVSTPAQREQTKWLIVAIALNAILIILTAVFASRAFAAAGTAEAAIYILLAHTVEMLGNLVLVLAVGIAILRYRLWDIEVVVNRALIYGPLSVILAAIFAVSVALINQTTRQLLGAEATVTAAAASALIVATFFQPIRLRIEKWINKKVYPDNANLARELVEISDPRFVLPVPALAQHVAQRISTLVNSDTGAVYLLQKGRGLRLAASAKPRGKLPTAFKLDAKAHQELSAGRITNEGPAHFLVPLYVPRLRSKQLVGVLALGMRKNGRGFSSDDKRALMELGGQVGTALYAAQLREQK